MQKQKIDDFYLVLQNTYNAIEVALFKNSTIIEKKIIDKIEASKNLIPVINDILSSNKIEIKDLNFMGANKGPGPFTTLRVVITTVNALNFSTGLPLIEVDGLEALLNEYENSKFPITVAILNAFNNDVYYGIYNDKPIEIGWKNINNLLEYLKAKFINQEIRFLGNAVELYKNEVNNILPNAVFEEENPATCSLEQIAIISYEKWKDKKNICNQILPLYLKDTSQYKK